MSQSPAFRAAPVFPPHGRWTLPAGLALVAALTLTPSRHWPSEKADPFCLSCGGGFPADAAANLALFVPLGFALRMRGVAKAPAILIGAGLSAGVEIAQTGIPGRHPALLDVISNTSGAAIGAALAETERGVQLAGRLARLGRRCARPAPREADRLAAASAVGACALLAAAAWLLRPAVPEGDCFVSSHALDLEPRGVVRIGAGTGPEDRFPGAIRSVRIYGRVLDEEEIRQEMQLTAGGGRRATRPAAGLAAAYPYADRSLPGEIPPDPALDLTTAMTIEAWVHPEAVPIGYANVVQKEGDAYFLTAGWQGGSLQPTAGGRFGGVLESVVSPVAIPLRQWTHLAATYDGAVLKLYIDGRIVARWTRWARVRTTAASIGPATAAPGLLASGTRGALRQGKPIAVSVWLDGAPSELAPLFAVRRRDASDVWVIALDGRAVVVRVRTHATALGLFSPDVRIAANAGAPALGGRLNLRVFRNGSDYCADANHAVACAAAPGPRSAWAILVDARAIPARLHPAIDSLWLGLLWWPAGLWVRSRRVVPLVLGLQMLALTLVPWALALGAGGFNQWTPALAGFSMGVFHARRRRGASPDSGNLLAR